MLTGYKTKLGAVGLALAGIAMIISTMTSDAPNMQTVMEGAGMVATALAAFGLGSKIERK